VTWRGSGLERIVVREEREPADLLFGAGAAFLGGLAAGVVLWSLQVHRSRRDLFSKSPVRRLAALGYLGGHPGVETTRLLTDYVRWEARPALRRRGLKLLRRMNDYLD
jgi:hypothetical protein